MTGKYKEFRKQKLLITSPILTQAEIIKKINHNTRRSYQLFDLLVWNSKTYEPTK